MLEDVIETCIAQLSKDPTRGKQGQPAHTLLLFPH